VVDTDAPASAALTAACSGAESIAQRNRSRAPSATSDSRRRATSPNAAELTAAAEAGCTRAICATRRSVRVYACYLCDKAFSEAAGLRRHVQVHTGHRPFTCSLCGQSFTRANNLRHHERHVHTSSRPCECFECGKLFKRSKELKRHVLIHTDAKPYSCRHCSERFRWRNQLKTHLLKSHGEGASFTCDVCRKKFICADQLRKHVRRHEGVKPHVCRECPMRFCTAYELTRHRCHRSVHSGYKQFSRGFCDWTSKDS